MPKFKVEWVKRYYRTGTLIVEADSAEEAEYLVWNMDQDEWEPGTLIEHDESEIDSVLEVKEDA